MSDLTAYKITTESGYSWSTDMSATTTLEKAQDYFLGQMFNIGSYPEEIMDMAMKVEKLK